MISKKRRVVLLGGLVAGALSWGVWSYSPSIHRAEAGTSEHRHAKGDHGGEDHDHGDDHAKSSEPRDVQGGNSREADPHDHSEEESHGRGTRGDDHDHSGHAHARKGGSDGLCPEHKVPEAEDALCQPDRLQTLAPGQGMKVRLAAEHAAERVGMAAASPVPATEEGQAWPGQTVFNKNRVARLTSLSGGTLKDVRADLGDQVRAGALLASIVSPEGAALKGSLKEAQHRRHLAESVYLREKDLFSKGITSRHEFELVEGEWRQAKNAEDVLRQQLENYGLSAGSGSALTVRSPIAGAVIERSAFVGEAVAPGSPLFTVADMSTLWIDVSLPEGALADIKPGMEVTATFSAFPGRAFGAKIFWIAPAVDEKTRMLKALAEVQNRDGLLRAGLFGEVRPVAGVTGGAFAVPTDALQSIDGIPYVFIQLEKDLFELRRVAAGRKSGKTVLVNEGISPKDRVVIAQAHALKSEVLKARLGASCADH